MDQHRADYRAASACHYCGTVFTPDNPGTKDHVIPKRFGNFGSANLVRACMACNSLKGDMTLDALIAEAATFQAMADRFMAIARHVGRVAAERSLIPIIVLPPINSETCANNDCDSDENREC